MAMFHVVFIDFWATWCRPCVNGMKEMENAKDELTARGVDFVYDNAIPHYLIYDSKGKLVKTISGWTGMDNKTFHHHICDFSIAMNTNRLMKKKDMTW